ncbi:MAG: hypothetical protein KDB07_10905 [Planctomycetes bacterium]|nr:hypothetical protein [Planctomycetota bacterium]
MNVRTLLLSAIFLMALSCVSTGAGDTSPFEIDEGSIPTDSVGGAGNTGPVTTRDYDPLEVRDMLETFLKGSEEERIAIGNDLVAIGKPAIPHILRAQQRAKEQSLILELLRITSRIDEATTLPSDPDPAVEGPKDPNANEEQPAVTENGKLPPSTSETVQPAEDLIDVGFDQEQVDNFILNRFNAARRAFDAGSFDRTIELCKAILTLSPQSRYRKEVLQLMLDAQSGEQSDRRLAGTIGFDRKYAVFADATDGSLARALTLSVFLTNVGRLPITIDFGSGGEGNESVLVLDITLSEESLTDLSSTRGRIGLPVVGEVVRLEAGQTHRFTLEVTDFSGLSPGGGAKQILSRVNAFGSLRPAKLTVHRTENEDERVFRPILLSSDEILVMPAKFDLPLAERAPVAYIKAQLATLNVANLHLGFHFLKAKDFKEALSLLLADDLRTASVREQEARLSLASRITNRPYNLRIEDWIEWWKNNRFRY